MDERNQRLATLLNSKVHGATSPLLNMVIRAETHSIIRAEVASVLNELISLGELEGPLPMIDTNNRDEKEWLEMRLRGLSVRLWTEQGMELTSLFSHDMSNPLHREIAFARDTLSDIQVQDRDRSPNHIDIQCKNPLTYEPWFFKPPGGIAPGFRWGFHG